MKNRDEARHPTATRSAAREIFFGFSDFPRKLILSAAVGILAGAVGLAFRGGIRWAGAFRSEHPELIYALPLTGLLIFGLYRLFRYRSEPGVDTIFSSIHSGSKLRFAQAPLVFLASLLTHLAGGSAGREGAVLELGACVGAKTARLLRWGHKFKKLSILCGMTAAFSALFGTPLAAFFFVMEITGPKIFHYRGAFFCLISSLFGFALLPLFGLISPILTPETPPTFDAAHLFLTLILTFVCGGIGTLFCLAMRWIPALISTLFPNGYLRGFFGGAAVLALTLLSGTTRYNGLGRDAILGALGGHALLADPIRKTILTSVTLGSGFKGGDLIPAIFVGVTGGAVAGAWLELPGGFGAAVGLVTLFTVVTRCRLAAIFLALEMFGWETALYAIPVAVIAYLFSGDWSLFRTPRLLDPFDVDGK